MKKKGYSCFVIDGADRARALEIIKPSYSKVIAHHCTFIFGDREDNDPPVSTFDIELLSVVDSGDGIQAVLVSVDDSITAPDGRTFHITWSLDPTKKKPKDSNMLIKQAPKLGAITPIDPKIIVRGVYQFIPFG